MNQQDIMIVFVSAGSQEEAQKIAKAVVEARAAACATILPSVRSLYWWEGKIADEQESVLLLKTTIEKYSRVEELVRSHHSYTTPEILAVPVAKGLDQYLAWVRNETT